MKLYRVTLKGMTCSSTDTNYGISFVVAEDPTQAYERVKKFLTDDDIGFSKDREMDKIELIADEYRFSDCGTILYLPVQSKPEETA